MGEKKEKAQKKKKKDKRGEVEASWRWRETRDVETSGGGWAVGRRQSVKNRKIIECYLCKSTTA